MTITLAAVYTPIGIQGGLTGALFREFAFTLAGAVIVSGVVALTLSPMMGSKLLRAGDTERGFAGHDQPPLRRGPRRRYTRLLAGTLAVPAGRARRCGSIVVAADRARSTCSRRRSWRRTRTRASSSGSSRRRPTRRSTRPSSSPTQVNDVYRSFPETESIFQITFPTGGFGGMVTKPWSEREKTTAAAPGRGGRRARRRSRACA